MAQGKTKIYIGGLIPGARPFPILNRHLGIPPYAGKKPYRAIFDSMDFSFMEIVRNPEDADFFLMPHNYSSRMDRDYLDRFILLASKYKKRVILFAYGDMEEDIRFPNTVVFRCAQYAHQKRNYEIIIPAQIYDRDILDDDAFSPREKKNKPTVSFCGWAGFNSATQGFKYLLKIIPLDFKKYFLFDKYADVRKQGIYFRRRAIKALQASAIVDTAFLIRDFYSANKYTIKGDPAELRKEYIKNIVNSDFVLTPRGDGNYSIRFYEALALGRIPVLIDTECVLPLEDTIDYKKFVVFVPYADIKNTDIYIRKFWDARDSNEFQSAQKLARDTFMKYLKLDSFLKHAMENKNILLCGK